jgi:ABC-type phosphate/phosphonate transport system substrate-binding protein
MAHFFSVTKKAIALVGLVAFWSGLCGSNRPALAEESRAVATENPLILVVMDPLALPLSCPCVKGYAQSDYQKLADRLQARLKRPVKLVFNESLTAALRDQTEGKADLVIGKYSVVLADAAKNQRAATPLALLTGKDGSTTQTGLIVVPSGDPAQSVDDLRDYRIIFGPAECDEKSQAALALLKKHGIDPPAELETSAACSDGATLILDLRGKARAAAVISSYAKPLLEGCGTIKKGALRVVGETEPVPFVAAFAVGSMAAGEQSRLLDALIQTSLDPLLRIALETQSGFVAVDEKVAQAAKKK